MAETGGLDAPTGYGREDAFDYEDWLRRELSSVAGVPRWRRASTWRRLGVAALVLLLVALLIVL